MGKSSGGDQFKKNTVKIPSPVMSKKSRFGYHSEAATRPPGKNSAKVSPAVTSFDRGTRRLWKKKDVPLSRNRNGEYDVANTVGLGVVPQGAYQPKRVGANGLHGWGGGGKECPGGPTPEEARKYSQKKYQRKYSQKTYKKKKKNKIIYKNETKNNKIKEAETQLQSLATAPTDNVEEGGGRTVSLQMILSRLGGWDQKKS